ncbi:MAG: 23S rRNA (guanosine(2251)-2'-O)-methyltransferase RlmB [Bacteroidetes bacterium]|nr:23S rRNA (guanosine(2251)-2'-O)-methyltransferase RlmB [Bacteroidota bacterium]MBV6461170.1 putative TrmH family tRNA/rRNA methyltransferase [Flavobacteriales bacterium]WKZ75421.1 MAG: 23S rRNA (guanosine(2251)-2'-O)-methyltransferase RlmB [Vicingaceae bacterium]MCL4814994.1 23S rRNA (guanosine(2251)-2'-O)-methyltransferase RlmB [Flavobacteriales bacterium]NOG96125.1 23S rRNA (guanosine(2251)-2'-O)-methyltransferase RlmB [Bacteroidota bacterium]
MQKEDEFIFGIHPIIEAIKAGREIERIWLQMGLHGPNVGELRKLIKQHEIAVQNVPVQKLNKISNRNHQGVIAFISPITFYHVEEIIPFIYENAQFPLFLVLDRISDVRNFGAICRTAECAGVDAIIIPHKGAAMIHSDAMKTSAGALNRIRVCKSTNLKTTVRLLKDSGLQIVACTEKTTDTIYKAHLNTPLCIIMGSEEDGISEELFSLCDQKIKIPMQGEIGSLNVSVATAVVLYETLRQRLIE